MDGWMHASYQGTDHARSGEMREDFRQAQVRWRVVVGPAVMAHGFGTWLLTAAARKRCVVGASSGRRKFFFFFILFFNFERDLSLSEKI
jgi:hypothetical protein